MSDTHTEELFEREWALRQAASEYFKASNFANAKKLREAALAYAEASNEVDEAVGTLREETGRG